MNFFRNLKFCKDNSQFSTKIWLTRTNKFQEYTNSRNEEMKRVYSIMLPREYIRSFTRE